MSKRRPKEIERIKQELFELLDDKLSDETKEEFTSSVLSEVLDAIAVHVYSERMSWLATMGRAVEARIEKREESQKPEPKPECGFMDDLKKV